MPLAALGPILMGATGVSAAATTGAWAAIGAGAGVAGNLIGASKVASGAKSAAEIQAASTMEAAKLADAATQRAEVFQRQQAENAFQNAEVSRRGNYDLNAAREHRLGSVGEMYGQGPREIPAYVPGVDPNFTGPLPSVGGALEARPVGSGMTPAAAAASGGVDPKIASFIAQYQQAHPVSEGIAPLADAIAKQFPGVSRYMYGQTPSNNELNIGGQKYKVLGGENTPGAYWYQPGMNDSPAAARLGSVGSYLSATPARLPVPVTPALALPNPYRPGAIGSYL